MNVYRGTFLEGFSLADSPAFDEWVLVQREETRRWVLEALHRLSTNYEMQEEYVRSIGYAQRALVLEPWDEEAHRQLMRSLTLAVNVVWPLPNMRPVAGCCARNWTSIPRRRQCALADSHP